MREYAEVQYQRVYENKRIYLAWVTSDELTFPDRTTSFRGWMLEMPEPETYYFKENVGIHVWIPLKGAGGGFVLRSETPPHRIYVELSSRRGHPTAPGVSLVGQLMLDRMFERLMHLKSGAPIRNIIGRKVKL